MANHPSSKKRIRQNESKRLSNRYYARSARNTLKLLRNTTVKSEAEALLPKVNSMLDKLAGKNVIHSKKASNLKSGLAKHVANLPS